MDDTMNQPLIKVSLINKSLQRKITEIIEKNKLTAKTIASLNVDSLSKNENELRVLVLLKKKALLMKERPLTLVSSRKLFRGTSITPQQLVYREERGNGFDGFFTSLDPVSKLQRTKKLLAENDADKVAAVRAKEASKYGQVAPVPNEWKWNFSWSSIPHPALESFLNGKDPKFNFRHPLRKQRQELIDHLVSELFWYFRKGVPQYYLNKMLDKLLQDFPSFNDETTCVGYNWLRPLITNAFRGLTRVGIPKRKRAVVKARKVTITKRSLCDNDIVMEILNKDLTTVPKVEEALNLQTCVQKVEPASVRHSEFLAKLIQFYLIYKNKKRTSFYQLYPQFKYLYEGEEPNMREQITIQLIHNSLAASGLLVDKNVKGVGIHFRFYETQHYEDLCDGSLLTGSVYVGDHSVIPEVTVSMGLFLICALNTILGLEYPPSQLDFLVYVEKQFLNCHRSTFTPMASQLKKDIYRKRGPSTPASSALDINDNDESNSRLSDF